MITSFFTRFWKNLETAVGSNQYSSNDLQRAAYVFQKHFVRSEKGVMEIALGNEEYTTEELGKLFNLDQILRRFESFSYFQF